MADAQSISQTSLQDGHITEAEASLYDRQIRLWGLEAQNRMRSSTILLLSLRSLAHETIKNLVLAGIGRLIIMDDGQVSEEDLGSGFLFREEDGAVGTDRTTAALPQIQSLNPLVQLSSFSTLSPFDGGLEKEDDMTVFLRREKVDIVIGCDLAQSQFTSVDRAARKADVMMYAAGSYGFYGYVFADLGADYEFVFTPKANKENPAPGIQKKKLSYPSFETVLAGSTWAEDVEAAQGGSPFRGLTKRMTTDANPSLVLGILALWEYESRQSRLPAGTDEDRSEMGQLAEAARTRLGVNAKAVPGVDSDLLDHLASHATDFFPPTLAILGGLLAQDVLRALSRKDRPLVNLLTVDSLGGNGRVSRWAMAEAVDA
ncbi:ubiquitin-like 1-activating enzyme E1 A, partial [Tremellales sp. Uapishka_1]